jgi:hypothetical protein
MCPTRRVDDSGSADMIVSPVTVTLEDAFEVTQESFGPFSFTTHSKVEDHRSLRATVLPKVGLVVFSSAIVHLHIHRGLVCLDIVALEQFLAHGRSDRTQKFTNAHDPPIQSRSGQVDAGFPFQDRALSVERHVIRVFAHYGVDHHPITGQAFVDDPGWQRRGLHSLLLTIFTGSLFAFGHPHKVFSRLDVKLLRSLVADHSGLFATLAADALFGCASNDLFGPRQLRRQLLPARMLARRF